MAHALGNLFDIEDPKCITTPPRSRKKSVSIRTPPSDQELDDLIFGDRLSAPQTHPSTPKSGSEHATSSRPARSHAGVQTPVTPSELEGAIANNNISTPTADGGPAHPAIQTFWNPPMNKWRVLCACLVYFGNGLSDSAPGALIPYMETFYSIGYAVVSLIFVANAAGFVSAAFCTDGLLLARLGRARTLVVSELIMLAGYVVLVCTPPAFAGVVAAFFLLGFGCAINLALNNVFCSTLANSTLLLGLTHGSYGVGGTVGPIVATALAGSGVLWSRFYFLTMGVRVVCVVFNAWAFWNYEKENSGGGDDDDDDDDDDVVIAGAGAAVATEANLLTELEQTASRRAAAETRAEGGEDVRQQQQTTTPKPTKRELLKQALRNRVTVGGALFIFMYQGAEVAIAGWVISFLIDYRGGDPAQVGYVTAGFFGGITLGRFALAPFCHHRLIGGERRAVVIFTLGALALDLLVWLVPNLLSNAVFVALCGLLLGPVYPCAQTVFARLLVDRRHLMTTSVGFISGAGSSGGALVPFVTGALAQVRGSGTWVLHPVCVVAFVGMVVCWWAMPGGGRKVKGRE
ncbi:MFS efflux transporter [Lasiodiplodia theobromae]|uniref:MFS efflux transporter n=1 Tax=Lasiodiplodia theobromae TaxID=45133 RepID=UPI0015C30FBC|nr:MFS efflux transporter [Lasiodiplodia theobromae]KAF4536765.1 MFS efflux transporter [Lasiodiplodia theobromae]